MAATVGDVLHSDAPIVMIEAAAGCGKTYCAVEYAKEAALRLPNRGILLLSHTHAACSVFEGRIGNTTRQIHVDTLASFCVKIVAPYATALQLPTPLEKYIGKYSGSISFDDVPKIAASLLKRCPSIASVIAACYPIIILDEHQDSSIDQHEVMQILSVVGKAKLRIFGDPMQAIYGKGDNLVNWSQLWAAADDRYVLDTPHRWSKQAELGEWILNARSGLENGQKIWINKGLIKVTNLPNLASYTTILDRDRCYNLITQFRRNQGKKVILAHTNEMVSEIAGLTGWSIKINEGARIEQMEDYLETVIYAIDNPQKLASEFLDFMETMGAGLPKSTIEPLKKRLLDTGIDRKRLGASQARFLEPLEFIYSNPNHQGIALAANGYIHDPPNGYKIQRYEPIKQLISLASTEDPQATLSVLTRARRLRPIPDISVSTIHKAKGLEYDHVMLLPVDKHQYGKNTAKLLYVALSRACKSIELIMSADNASQYFEPMTN